MSERITRKSVSFGRPFSLRDLDGIQPPGTYLIETIEEPVSTLSRQVYRRVLTTITLPAVEKTALTRQVIAIDPVELEAALRRDVDPGPPCESDGQS